MAETKPPVPPPPVSASFNKLLGGCVKVIVEIVATIVLAALFPFVLLLGLMHWMWPWFSSVPTEPRNLDDALIALASVAGVLWSGAIVAYSIHRKYTPPLRTGVQLLNFAILAPLVGLVAEGALLRTVFYFAMWFYVFDTGFSMVNLEILKQKFLRAPPQQPNETPEEAKARQQQTNAQLRVVELFKRVAHGTPYFAIVSALCLITVITGRHSVIEWSCLAVLVVSLFLMLPEVFNIVDPEQGSVS